MDPLSELLSDVRIRDAVFVRTRIGAPGLLRVGPVAQPCFHLVTEGRVWLHPASGQEPVPLQCGDIAFFPQGQAHRLSGSPLPGEAAEVDLGAQWSSPGPPGAAVLDAPSGQMPGQRGVGRTISGCMHIEGVAPAWLLGGLPPWLTVQWGERQLPQWLSIGLAYLEQELSREHLARQAVIDRLGDVLFIQSLRSYLDSASDMPAGWLMGLKDGMVSRVLGAMHRDPARAWQLSDLARVGCVSRSVLAERFTQLLGMPPLAYLTRHRMHVAARRLQRSAEPVGDVARSVGYQSAAAFA